MMVMMEHFRKWIELLALLQNFAELATTVFLDRVLARAPAVVLMD